MTQPTYEELWSRARNATNATVPQLRAIEPGEIWDVPLNGKSPQERVPSIQTAIYTTFGAGSAYKTRIRDGHLYVIRLRDEDIKNGHSS